MESAPFEAEKTGHTGALDTSKIAAMESAPFEAEKRAGGRERGRDRHRRRNGVRSFRSGEAGFLGNLVMELVAEPQWSPLLSKRRSVARSVR